MKKFEEYTYIRPDLQKVQSQFQEALTSFKHAGTFEEQDAAMKEIYRIRNTADTMVNLVLIRHSIDTNDDYYKNEQDIMDDLQPHFQAMESEFYKELTASSFRKELENKWGKQLFALAELQLKTFSPEVLEDLQQENRLSSQYTKLVASAKIHFDGKEYTLAQLQPFTESPDRNIRKRAGKARFSFFSERAEEFDRIYDELVSIRAGIAKKLGFANFVELGYARMNRTDYDADMVKNSGSRSGRSSSLQPKSTESARDPGWVWKN